MFFCTLIILWIPWLDYSFEIIDSKKLEGVFPEDNDTIINREAWLSRGFQKQKEAYLKSTIGLKEDLIRIRNQIDYSLFDKIHAKNVYVGKDGFLFRFYNPEFNSKSNYIGDEKIKNNVQKFQKLNDTISKRGAKLIMAITPAKHYYHYDKLPEEFKDPYINDPNNYLDYKKYFAQSNVPIIDINQMFLDLKQTSKFPLFAKQGIHWTAMGSLIAMDSLVGFLSKIDNKRYQRIIYDGYQPGEEFLPDTDIGNTLNLIFGLDELELQYHINLREKDSTLNKPRIILVGDSYVHAPLWSGYLHKLFDLKSKFSYYNRELQAFDGQLLDINSIDIWSEIDESDYVIFLSTISNLASMPWGFEKRLGFE